MGHPDVAYVSAEAVLDTSVKSRLEAVGRVIKENCLRSRPLAGVRSTWRVVAKLYIAHVGWSRCDRARRRLAAPTTTPTDERSIGAQIICVAKPATSLQHRLLVYTASTMFNQLANT